MVLTDDYVKNHLPESIMIAKVHMKKNRKVWDQKHKNKGEDDGLYPTQETPTPKKQT